MASMQAKGSSPQLKPWVVVSGLGVFERRAVSEPWGWRMVRYHQQGGRLGRVGEGSQAAALLVREEDQCCQLFL